MSESKIQSDCVKWLWNEHPETRGCFFAVQNEGAKLSTKVIIEAMLFIIKNINNYKIIISKANEIINLCKKGNKLSGAISKAMGVVPGVSDTIFLWKSKAYLIEFKTDTGRQSPDQKRWEIAVTKQGFQYFIIRSLADFKKLMSSIVKPDC